MKSKHYIATAIFFMMSIFILIMSACTSAAHTFIVAFDYNDGVTATTSVTVKGDSVVQEPDDPVRTGYLFEYWYFDDDEVAYDFSSPVTQNMTLRAKWSAIEYTVTVHIDENNVYTEQVPYGGQFACPKAPEKDGYEFEGWFVDEAGMKAYDFSAEVYSDFDLWAKYKNMTAAYYNVTFNLNYAGAPAASVVSVEENTPAVRPQDPARGGYEFTGWYTDKGCSVIYDFDKAVTADVQLYAGWKEIEGVKKYKFEAELTDFSELSGTGYSNEAKGPSMIQRDLSGEAGASNGFWIGYMYLKGCSLTFEIVSESNVTDATLSLRLSGEIVNAFSLNSDDFTVVLNGNKINYGSILIDGIPTGVGSGAAAFRDFEIGKNLTLKEGVNTIVLTVNNNKPLTGTDGNVAGGKISATAPLIDCIKITTAAQLSWTPYPDLLMERYSFWDIDTDYEGIIDN